MNHHQEEGHSASKHALVFAGFKDRTPQTLRSVKAALIGELRLEIEAARRLIERFPSVVATAASEQELDSALQVLLRAGALAEIINDPSALQALGSTTPRTRSAKPDPQTPRLSDEEQLEELLFSLDQACLLPSSAEILEEIRPTQKLVQGTSLAGISAALNQPLPFDVWSHILLTAIAVICAGLIGYYF